MIEEIHWLLESDSEAKKYYSTLPRYAREAVDKHASEIDSFRSMRLFAETFMQDDSYRGA